MSYSPGPWKRAVDFFGVEDANGNLVLLEKFSLGSSHHSEGNTTLALAAPQLLEELEHVTKAFENLLLYASLNPAWADNGDSIAEITIAHSRAIIAKAKGDAS